MKQGRKAVALRGRQEKNNERRLRFNKDYLDDARNRRKGNRRG